MKNNLLKTTKILSLASVLIMSSACYRSAERPAVVNKSISEKVFGMNDVSEITGEKSKVVYVAGGEKESVKALDATLKQNKIEGKVDAILKKVKSDAAKAALDAQLKDGAVAIVVLKDQVKILKVVAETDLSMSYDVLSLKYMSRMKALSKTSDIQAQSSILRELEDLKYTSPKKLGEKFGLVEIAALKVEKVGTLENERTDYDEKKSILNVSEKPFELSTHLVIGDEIGAAASSEESAEATKE